MADKRYALAFKELLESVIIAIILALIIRTFLFQFFWIPSRSMEPTLLINDRIIVTRFSYWFNEPQRGDVVVFKYPLDPKKDYVKRLIGLPGEKIQIINSKLYINDILVEESYLPEGLKFGDFGPIQVPEGNYFMMGDNRNNSSDSRVWGFVEEDLLIGKAQFIYWPLGRMGRVN
ncbi:MAG: signal peptidase [Clostridia bacterium]|nr:signal peptidase [Clostridia bacterium]MDN5322741.1 signal peptidase [Clostridia bacterium]